MEKTCQNCGKVIPAHNAARRYCDAAACQRARKREWQKRKLATDPAYKGNNADAQRRWRERHPEYWRTYRENHPRYVERNRERQRLRNHRRWGKHTGSASLQPEELIAKMDAGLPIKSGTYRLIPLQGEVIAKMDAVLVEITRT